MPTREFDVIVWGATGFTGQLVAEYLAQTYGSDGELRWALAGRNRSKLEQVRDSLPNMSDPSPLPLVIADSGDRQSLADMAGRTRVVCTTVGPYARYGSDLVQACIEAGTDYCDLTGEVQWMVRMIEQHQAAAEQSGARIVHTCGFDSVPSDMGTWYLQQVATRNNGRPAKQVKSRIRRMQGGASGGTIASMMVMMEEAQADPSIRDIMADPYVLYPAGTAPGQDPGDQRGAVYDKDFNSWTAPFVMAAINTRVVRRSNALLGFPWGEDFRFDESMLSKSRLVAGAGSLAGGLGLIALALGPTRRLLARVLPKPGEGPDAATREAGHYQLDFLGIDPADRSADTAVSVTGHLDPGYGSTSRMLGEAAVCLALDTPVTGGGFWTPASALGESYLQRLQTRAGLDFEELDPTSLTS